MTAIPPAIHPDGRYSAKEASALLGIHRDTLRRWVNMGKIRQYMQKSTLHPRYRGKDLLALWRSEV